MAGSDEAPEEAIGPAADGEDPETQLDNPKASPEEPEEPEAPEGTEEPGEPLIEEEPVEEPEVEVPMQMQLHN